MENKALSETLQKEIDRATPEVRLQVYKTCLEIVKERVKDPNFRDTNNEKCFPNAGGGLCLLIRTIGAGNTYYTDTIFERGSCHYDTEIVYPELEPYLKNRGYEEGFKPHLFTFEHKHTWRQVVLEDIIINLEKQLSNGKQ